MQVFGFLCIAALITQGFCCTRKKNPTKLNVWQRMVGQQITTAPYSGNDSPVNTGDQLSCNFDSGSCCWSNAQPPADQLDWVTVTGPTEDKKMQSSFGTTTAFSGSALGVGTETGSGSSQSAQLYSCPIQCTNGPVTISVQHWQTKDVTLQICQETDPNGPSSNCQPLPATSGNTDSVTLPGGQNVRLVIIASGFTARGGSVTMIDNINVQFSPCVSTTISTTLPVTTIPPAVCKTITCNFEQGNTCSYQNLDASSGGGSKQWQVVTPPIGNPLTGVRNAAEGSKCAAVQLNPGDSAVMYTTVNFPAGYIVQFQGYRATQGVDLMACCDSTSNCPFSTTNQVQVSDYNSWKQATVTCPAGTQKVLFQAKNSQNNYGAVGLDNIQVVSQVGASPLC